jgi:ribosome-associated protein
MSDDESLELARRIARLTLTKKAEDVHILDLRDLSSVTDFFVICHGDSEIQVKAIADAVLEGLKKEGVRVWHKEGYDYMNWVLLDYVDVVVHVFHRDVRTFYGLERLWGDASVETVVEEH